MSKRAVGYVRVSTEDQATHGVSLDAQQAKLQALAQLHDFDLVEVVVDAAASAKDLRRPGMARLLQLVDRREVDVVGIVKLDRLTRNVRDLADLLERFERRSVSLISVEESLDTATAAGRLVLNVMCSVAQWEREVIGERTRAALQHKRARGQRVSRHPPFGFAVADDGCTLVEADAEQEILRLVRSLRDAGAPLRAIAEALNERGLTTRTGGPWKHQYVGRLLRKAG